MQPHYPYRLLGTSGEFCIASAQDARDCESVQFVSGIALEHGRGAADGGGDERLLLSVGINDCEAKLARMRMADVWAMVKPLQGEGDVCVDE